MGRRWQKTFAAIALPLGVLIHATTTHAACPYMAHNVTTLISINGVPSYGKHLNYGVGVSQGYKAHTLGDAYKTEVVTCSGLNCPTDGSAWVYQMYVWVQATGQFNVIQSNHMLIYTTRLEEACRAAL